MRLDQEIVSLGGMHIVVTGQLLDHMDGKLPGPVGNTSPPQVMEGVGRVPAGYWLFNFLKKNQQFIFIYVDYENKVVAYFHFSVILISYGEEKDFRKIH